MTDRKIEGDFSNVRFAWEDDDGARRAFIRKLTDAADRQRAESAAAANASAAAADSGDPLLGRKDDVDKRERPELLPPVALREVSAALAYGARKYSDDNWRLVANAGGPRGRYVGAALRHLLAYMGGEKHDRETNLHHLAHTACCVLFILEMEISGHERP